MSTHTTEPIPQTLPVQHDDPSPEPVTGRARLGYMPGLDGFRAVAVMAVLAYHGEISGFTGGFLGVEVFFVISGYLITALLLAEWGSDHRIGLKMFWLRRARRLLPALFALLSVTVVVAVLFYPDEVASLRGDVISALVYVANWNFIIVGKSYFESMGRPSLVQHLWSLAVEEQFYLVWPLLFVAGMRRLGKRLLLVLVVLGAIGSTALMWVLFVPGEDPSRVYLGTDTRAAGLLIGCALAFVWSPWRLSASVGRYARLILDLLGVVALGFVLVMLYSTDEFSDSLYRGGFARLSLATAVVIAVVVHPAARLGRVMGVAPLRWIGLRSYGIYLWHWPVFMLTRPGQDIEVYGWQLLSLRLVITFVVAEISYRFIEMPVRSGALGRWFKRLRAGEVGRGARVGWSLAGLATASAMIVLVVAVGRAVPPPPPSYLTMPDGATTDGVDPSKPFDVPVETTTTEPPTTTTAVPDAVPVTEPPPTIPPVPVPGLVTNKVVVSIGDSVMLGAAGALKALGPRVTVDAVVGRQVSQGIADVNYRADVGELGDVVIIHLGNNGTFTDSQFDQIMAPLASMPKVIIVNCKVPRRWEESVNATIANGVARYPNAVLVDWYTISQSRPGVFWDDGMHLRPEGAALYAQSIAAVLADPNEDLSIPPLTTAPPPAPEPAPVEPAPAP